MFDTMLERLSAQSHVMRSVFLVVLCLAAFLPGIAALPPLDRDESRFIQATKQMAETGDYVDIRFQTEARYKKPIGIYWLQSAALKLTGADPQQDVWAYRLVSVTGATLSVLIVAALAAMMFGGATGLVAGILMTGMFMLAFEGRIAKTDAMLLATCLAAQACLARIYLSTQGSGKSRYAWLGFWLVLGAGILIKGPIAPLLALTTVLALCLADRSASWTKGLRALSGILIMSAVVAPWLILITLKSGNAFWAEAIGKDLLGKVATGQESHGAPPGYYMLIFSLFIWPMPVIAVQAGLAALSHFRTDARLRFLLAWYLPWWLLVELMPTKLPHYILPAYPAVILLAAAFLCGNFQNADNPPRGHGWVVNLTRLGLVLASCALIGLAIGLPIYAGTGTLAAGLLAALVIAITALTGLNLARTNDWSPVCKSSALSVGAIIMWALVAGYILPSARTLWPSTQISETFHRALNACPSPHLVSVNYHEPSLVVLAGTKTLLTSTRGAANALLADPTCTMVALPADERTDFNIAMGDKAKRLKTVETVAAVNYSKGKPLIIDLMVLVAP
jgi:4-amino-4-deoxy-L-arabinose transferase-like glycosyltransferase